LAARTRERALTDTRQQINLLLKELGNATADLRARHARIADLEQQFEEQRRQIVLIVTRAVSKARKSSAPKSSAAPPARSRGRIVVASKHRVFERKPPKLNSKHPRKLR
jgi:hypothetical protein